MTTLSIKNFPWEQFVRAFKSSSLSFLSENLCRFVAKVGNYLDIFPYLVQYLKTIAILMEFV